MPRTSNKKKVCVNHYKAIFDEYSKDVNIPIATVGRIMTNFVLTRDTGECFLCAEKASKK